MVARIIVGMGLYFTTLSAAPVVDIIFLHKNDANGRPAAPYTIGSQVTVEGVVTAGTNIYSQVNFEVFIQDQSGGINLFVRGNMPMHVNLGDRLRVTGIIQQYCGLTEIQNFSELTVLERNCPLPEPLILTCSEVANGFLEDFSEPNESRLIRINNVRKTADIDAYSCMIEDHTGSCILFRDIDAKLPEPPDGFFDVIGILKQYDKRTNQPLTGGYEISPRFAADFISKSGPIFISRPRAIDLSTHAIQIQWQTDRPSTTLFRFGRTEEYELGAIGDSAATIIHRVTLTGLQPATFYHGSAYSTDSTGTSKSDDVVLTTASAASTGQIKVFFTKSVDWKVAQLDSAAGNINLAAQTIDIINRARYSLDVCYYSLSHIEGYDIAEALRNAKKRGVSIRFIYEADNHNLHIASLKDLAGIPIINDRFGENAGMGAMHNKFIIVDHRDKSSATDDYLWVGSANATEGGAWDNAENMLLIQDETLCAAYTAEFEEMWGSSTEVADATASRFGIRKRDNTPHLFRIGGRLVEQYMSPSDATEDAIIRVIDQSQLSCYFCILTFTSTGIFKAMENKYFNTVGYQLRGVFERSEATDFSCYSLMSGQGANGWQPPADVHLDIIPKYLHHKYAIMDLEGLEVEPIVITGSHNWSSSANSVNDENTLIIHDRGIADLYFQEFSARYHESGGQAEWYSHVPRPFTASMDFQLYPNYPNPFHFSTVLSWRMPPTGQKGTIDIFNIKGERVLGLSIHQDGSERMTTIWHGTDATGGLLPSGIYFAKASGGSNVIKMIIMR